MTERRQFVGHSSTAEAAQFTGRSREITVDMQAETLRVHDGITPGGYPSPTDYAIRIIPGRRTG